jgi:glucose-1-phosphate adenylyltransferase
MDLLGHGVLILLGTMEGLLTLILAGGKATRLLPLARRQAKAVVPFAGRRLVDFTLENCARSVLGPPIILTQHLAATVSNHVRARWDGRTEVLSSHAAGERFRGTADAVRVALARKPEGDRVLILPCDQVYSTDYRWIVATHLMADAEMTLPVMRVTPEAARGRSILEAGPTGLVRSLLEKPEDPPGAPLAALGVYLFERRALETALADHADATDLCADLLPRLVAEGRRIAVRPFVGPWRDIDDVDAYFEAHSPYRRRGNYVWPGAHIAPSARVEESILLYGAEVGPGAHLRRVIVDEGVRVPAGARIGFDPVEDAAFGHVSPGGVTVIATAEAEAAIPA